nr:hypothetical protein [Tanacetum cinerariifolium]
MSPSKHTSTSITTLAYQVNKHLLVSPWQPHPSPHLHTFHSKILALPNHPKAVLSHYSTTEIDSGLAVPVFKQGDDPIDAINKMMAFLSTVVTSPKAVLMANLSSYGLDVLSEDTNSSAQQDAMILSVFEQLSNQVTNCNKVNTDNLITNESLSAKLERYKEQIRPMLYDGSVTAKEANVISIADSEETLMLEEERKYIVDNAAQASNATTIAPGMYNLDLVTLAPKDKNNRETHIYHLKHTREQAAILREIVEQAKSLNPLDSASYSACKYAKLIQKLLRYVRDTCPNIYKPSEKLVAITPNNKKEIVRFAKPVISSSTSQKQLGSSQTKTKQTSNNYVSTSTGVSQTTKSSRSKSTDNTNNDRILQISSSTQKKNKVEDHSRIVMSCLNKSNCVIEPSRNVHVVHSKLNTNFELIYVKCNSSMFDARHELCFLEFESDMNACLKSNSVKKAKKKEE